MKSYILLLGMLLLIIKSGHSQVDTLLAKKDSFELHAQLNDQFNKIQRLSAESLADSLKKTELEKQVAGLSVENEKERRELLAELKTIKNRDSLRKIKQQHQIDSLRSFVKGNAVIPFRDTLFLIYTRQGSFLPKERTEAISKRIEQLGDEYPYISDSLKLVPSEQNVDIFYKERLIVSVSELDAIWAGQNTMQLATTFRTTIDNSIRRYQDETSWQTLAKQSLLALLVLAVVAALIYGINKIYKLVLKLTVTRKAWYSKGVRINNYELLNSERQLKLLHFTFSILRWAAIILSVYLALPILFGIFPFTREISGLLIGYILSPLKRILSGMWHYVPNLITIIVVVTIFRYVLKFLNYIKTEIHEGRLNIPGFYQDWAIPTYQIVRVLVLAFMLIVIFPYMPGSDSGIFKGVSVFIGVLFTFGSAGALGNVVAGLVLTYMRAFKIGDRVKIGDVTGDIIGKTLLVTRIKTIQNEVISIPNSSVMNNHTLNYSSEAQDNGLIIHTTVTIGYDVPWRQVHQLLTEAALNTELIESTPAPYVLQTSLDDYYVSYRINAFTKEANRQAVIYSRLHENIQDHFNTAGVEIMSPHYKALRDGNATTIPPEYLDKDYQSPVFTIRNKEDDKSIIE